MSDEDEVGGISSCKKLDFLAALHAIGLSNGLLLLHRLSAVSTRLSEDWET